MKDLSDWVRRDGVPILKGPEKIKGFWRYVFYHDALNEKIQVLTDDQGKVWGWKAKDYPSDLVPAPEETLKSEIAAGPVEGMTITVERLTPRQEFAKAAMQGLIDKWGDVSTDVSQNAICKYAWQFADKMMEVEKGT